MARPERFELPAFWFVGGFRPLQQTTASDKGQENQQKALAAFGGRFVPSSRTLTRTLWQTANEQLTVEKQPDDHSIIDTESCDDDSESILAHGLIKPSCHIDTAPR